MFSVLFRGFRRDVFCRARARWSHPAPALPAPSSGLFVFVPCKSSVLVIFLNYYRCRRYTYIYTYNRRGRAVSSQSVFAWRPGNEPGAGAPQHHIRVDLTNYMRGDPPHHMRGDPTHHMRGDQLNIFGKPNSPYAGRSNSPYAGKPNIIFGETQTIFGETLIPYYIRGDPKLFAGEPNTISR